MNKEKKRDKNKDERNARNRKQITCSRGCVLTKIHWVDTSLENSQQHINATYMKSKPEQVHRLELLTEIMCWIYRNTLSFNIIIII